MAVLSWHRQIDKLIVEVKIIRAGVIDKIETLPDNSKIRRINGNCFTLRKSDLHRENWTPTYYDYKKQYMLITDSLERSKLNGLRHKLEQIILEKRVDYVEGGKTYYQKLHPEVIDNLNEILK